VDRVRQRRVQAAGDERVQLPEKRGERLARARRREDQRVVAGGDRRPSAPLRLTRLAERLAKPLPHERMEWRERVGRAPRPGPAGTLGRFPPTRALRHPALV
jgi:hypothetical protein